MDLNIFYNTIKGKLFNLGLFSYGELYYKEALLKVMEDYRSHIENENVIISKKEYESLKKDSYALWNYIDQ